MGECAVTAVVFREGATERFIRSGHGVVAGVENGVKGVGAGAEALDGNVEAMDAIERFDGGDFLAIDVEDGGGYRAGVVGPDFGPNRGGADVDDVEGDFGDGGANGGSVISNAGEEGIMGLFLDDAIEVLRFGGVVAPDADAVGEGNEGVHAAPVVEVVGGLDGVEGIGIAFPDEDHLAGRKAFKGKDAE